VSEKPRPPSALGRFLEDPDDPAFISPRRPKPQPAPTKAAAGTRGDDT
jgi:hypothetical protein